MEKISNCIPDKRIRSLLLEDLDYLSVAESDELFVCCKYRNLIPLVLDNRFTIAF